MLIPGNFAQQLKNFIEQVNQQPVSDQQQAITDFVNNQEQLIYQAIKNLQITILPGTIIVEGPSGSMTNAQPIVLNNQNSLFE